MRSRRLLGWTAVLAVLAVLAVAFTTDVQAHARERSEDTRLAGARAGLRVARSDLALTDLSTALTTQKRNGIQASVATTLGRTATTDSQLSGVEGVAFLQAIDIGTLHTCLGGVQQSLQQIVRRSQRGGRPGHHGGGRGLQDTSTAGVTTGSPTPSTSRTPSCCPSVQLLRLRHELGGRQHPDHHARPTWSTGPRWGTRCPASPPGRPRTRPGPRPCSRSVPRSSSTTPSGWPLRVGATSACRWPPPRSPRAPSSTRRPGRSSARPRWAAPSTRRCSSTRTGRRIWCGSRTAAVVRPRSGPSSSTPPAPGSRRPPRPPSCWRPISRWEAGVIEAPDLVVNGGRYFLFYSGNVWKGTDYAVGAATCTGPLGPCVDSSSAPVLASDAGMEGPGGESVFTGPSGATLDRLRRLGTRRGGLSEQPCSTCKSVRSRSRARLPSVRCRAGDPAVAASPWIRCRRPAPPWGSGGRTARRPARSGTRPRSPRWPDAGCSARAKLSTAPELE